MSCSAYPEVITFEAGRGYRKIQKKRCLAFSLLVFLLLFPGHGRKDSSHRLNAGGFSKIKDLWGKMFSDSVIRPRGRVPEEAFLPLGIVCSRLFREILRNSGKKPANSGKIAQVSFF